MTVSAALTKGVTAERTVKGKPGVILVRGLGGYEHKGIKAEQTADQHSVERVAHWLDNAFAVPGTGFRVGWDGVIGLIPGLGNLATLVPALWIVVHAVKAGASPAMLSRMALNVGIDSVVGAVPLLGNVFDFFWKSNQRNVSLLQQHQLQPETVRRRSRWVLGIWATVLAFMGLALVVVPIWVFVTLVHAFGVGSL